MRQSESLQLALLLRSCAILHEFSSKDTKFQLHPTSFIRGLFPVKQRSEMIYSWSPADASRVHLYGYEESHHNGNSYDEIRDSVIVSLQIAEEVGRQIHDRAMSFARQQLLDEADRAKQHSLKTAAENVLRGLLKE